MWPSYKFAAFVSLRSIHPTDTSDTHPSMTPQGFAVGSRKTEFPVVNCIRTSQLFITSLFLMMNHVRGRIEPVGMVIGILEILRTYILMNQNS